MKNPTISVIIPVYNEQLQIEKCLQSLNKQTNADFEVILVDDGSTDKTLSVISKYEPENYKIKILRQSHLGPAKARNLGAENAKGEILVFVDADMTFADNFLDKLTDPIAKNNAIGTHCDKEFVSNWHNNWARFWNYNQGIWTKSRIRNFSQRAVFRAVKKSNFAKVQGFDVGGYTDDLSLVKKLGKEPKTVRSTHFFHSNPDTLKEVFAQARWSAKREYKLGRFGALVQIIKHTLPFSIFTGLATLAKIKNPLYLFFKVVYDAGFALGIIEYKILNKAGSK